MRLKQIKLIGFKSFVDPTTLHLNGQLVGIVGPNGCGKSNIIDAVRWVLGESSAKDLRGESMVDVIFNGSTARKSIGQAAIELLFDNLESKLDREYANFSEVAIRREVDRSRQSEYYLNGKKCRKRDVTDLFAGTGLLQNGYAIIGQGTVSKIIESKPEDLRSFVEEAAEISIYKKRRHETELRMQHTEENLHRLQDILLEQIKLLEKLDKQQAAAKKYQNYQAEKQECEIKLLSIKAHQFNQQLIVQQQEIQQTSLELEKTLANKTNNFVNLEQLKLEQTDKFDKLSLAQEEYYSLIADISKLEQALQYKKDQQKKYQEDLTVLAVEITKITEQHTEDHKLQKQLMEDLSIINNKHDKLQQNKELVEKQCIAAQLDLQTWNEEFNVLQVKFLDKTNETEKIKSTIDHIDQLSKELYFRIDKLNQENANYNLNNLNTEILLLEKELRTEEALQQEQQQQLLQFLELIKQKKIQLKDLSEQKGQLQAKIHTLLGTIGSIQTLQQNALEVSSEQQAWLVKENLLKQTVFFDQLIIEDGWELAVGVILSRYLSATILPNDININQIPIESLHSIQNFKLGLLDNVLPEVAILTNNKTSILTKIKNNFIIANLFKNVYLAEDLIVALQERKNLLPEEYFVTKKGELIGFNWLIIDQMDPKQQILIRNKELQQLEKNLQQTETELIDVKSMIETEEQNLIDLDYKQTSITAIIKEQEYKTRQLIVLISSNKSKLDSITQRTEKIIIEIKEYQAKIQELAAKEVSLRAKLTLIIDESSYYTEQKQLLLTKKPQLQNNLDQLVEKNKLVINEFHISSLQQQNIVTKLKSLDEAKNRLTNQLDALKEKQNRLQQNLCTINAPLQPLELELEALLDNRLVQEKQVKLFKADLEQVEINIKQLEQNINKLDIVIEQHRSKIEQLNLEKSKVATRLATILEDLNDQALEQNISESDLELWQTKLDTAVKNLEKLGAVNLTAIDEFKLETERKQYLDAQCTDLTTALTTLKEAILKIDNETRKKFKETFEQINSNFQKLFPKLFGGGSAKLELDTDDWLVSGVTVLAQPPGKKNSTIYLLSGGEKALTAVALIFAIFQLNPAPFCILDEVDAPLDDANVARFSELLIDLSTKVQFIFITHNKTTMKIANQLIGVTMKEPGVSRLVSVNVDEAVSMIT